jgi:hypothetical protein
MPGFDGTGPMGRGARTGWGRGWCRPAYPVQKVDVKTGEEQTPAPEEIQKGMSQPPFGPVYGVGRGGIPWGCGRGYCGGRFRGRGRGRYWW